MEKMSPTGKPTAPPRRRASEGIALRVVETLGDHVAHGLLDGLLQPLFNAALETVQDDAPDRGEFAHHR